MNLSTKSYFAGFEMLATFHHLTPPMSLKLTTLLGGETRNPDPTLVLSCSFVFAMFGIFYHSSRPALGFDILSFGLFGGGLWLFGN